jgi:hypothetical protein
VTGCHRAGPPVCPAAAGGKGLFFASPHSNRLAWVRRGRVLFVAVMNSRVRGDFARLGCDLRLALR